MCKHILDGRGVSYDSKKIELPELYKLAARELNLSPSQHTQDIFKQILGGCSSVVNGLGALRNKLGDAHGQGKMPVRPAPRHAELAVNLSGSLALFLVAPDQSEKTEDEPKTYLCPKCKKGRLIFKKRIDPTMVWAQPQPG